MNLVIYSVLFLSLISSHVMANDCVKDGVSSLWKFDQKNLKISLVEYDSAEVCHPVSNQLNANFEFRFYKKKSVVHKMKIYWSDLTFSDDLVDGKLKPIITKEKDFKILKLPISKNDFDSYAVISLETQKVVAKGGSI